MNKPTWRDKSYKRIPKREQVDSNTLSKVLTCSSVGKVMKVFHTIENQLLCCSSCLYPPSCTTTNFSLDGRTRKRRLLFYCSILASLSKFAPLTGRHTKWGPGPEGSTSAIEHQNNRTIVDVFGFSI